MINTSYRIVEVRGKELYRVHRRTHVIAGACDYVYDIFLCECGCIEHAEEIIEALRAQENEKDSE